MPEYTDTELLAFLDEGLPAERMAAIENKLRTDLAFRQRIAALRNNRDQEGHGAGEIWRRWRLSCPTRQQLGTFLLGASEPAFADYIDFHIRTIGCRVCAANLDDLKSAQQPAGGTEARRRKYFQSSAGYLHSGHSEERRK